MARARKTGQVHPVELTDEQRAILEYHVNAADTPLGIAVRARVILLAGEGLDDSDIARRLGYDIGSVRRWRSRFAQRGMLGLMHELGVGETQNALQPLKREALRDRVVTAVRDAIVQGKLRPGAKVPEDELAQQLGVSRTPIREAIRILELQGLVRVSPKRGTYIRQLDPAEEADALAVRVALEELAIREAIERTTAEEWDHLCESLEDLLAEMTEAGRRNDPVRSVELDIEFHSLLVGAADNHFLLRSWHLVGMPFLIWSPERELYPQPRQDLVTGLSGRHRSLLTAVKTRDPEASVAAVREHIMRKLADITGPQPKVQRLKQRPRNSGES